MLFVDQWERRWVSDRFNGKVDIKLGPMEMFSIECHNVDDLVHCRMTKPREFFIREKVL